MTRKQTAAEIILARAARFATPLPDLLRPGRRERRCLDCDRALRADESDPCDRCNDTAYYAAQAAEDR